MSKRQFTSLLDMRSGGMLPALVVLSCAFLLGGLIGCGLAASVTGGANDSLTAYVQDYLAAARTGAAQSPALLPLVWEVARWPLLAILLGFTALGVMGIPILFLIRGFLFSFAVASFVRMFGALGGGIAFLLFGVSGLLAIPVLFILGVQGFWASCALAGRTLHSGKRDPVYDRVYFLRCGICSGVLALCVVLEYAAIPVFISNVAGRVIL